MDRPTPEGATRALHWIAYKGQWIALDCERLIAHGANAHEIIDAAKADGTNLPSVDFGDDLTKFTPASEVENFYRSPGLLRR
jgi:hypothetical protein